MKNEVDAYIAAAPKAAQPHLRELRKAIKAEVPNVEERIRYGMPSYKFQGRGLFGFAAWKNYVSIYPSGDARGLEKYKTHKATLSFPLNEALPIAKIRRLVKDRVRESSAAAKEIQKAGRDRRSASAR